MLPRKRQRTVADTLPEYRQPIAAPTADRRSNLVPLEQLWSIEDVWEIICGFCTGSALVSLSQVTKLLRDATIRTPAFECLAGRDVDGFVVPWQDPWNIMASATLHTGWNPSLHYRVRSGYLPRAMRALDRESLARRAVGSCLDGLPRCIEVELRFHGPSILLSGEAFDGEYGAESHYHYGAPARPASACSDYEYVNDYVYQLPNPCEPDMLPVLFPPEAHTREDARHARHQYETSDDATSSSDRSDSSEYSEDVD